jgi:hypothetical protein
VVETGFTQATGTAEREEVKAMIERHSPGSHAAYYRRRRQGL